MIAVRYDENIDLVHDAVLDGWRAVDLRDDRVSAKPYWRREALVADLDSGRHEWRTV